MRTTVRNLRAIIRRNLNEEAASIAKVESEGLALFVNDGDVQHTYVLYDPKKLLAMKNGDTDLGSTDCIVAMMITQKQENAWHASAVDNSAARKGYGPLMYDIVMRMEDGLVPDRVSVSDAASNVWSYYKKKRSDVEAKPLDNEEKPKTEPAIDDARVYEDGPENPLNYAYFSKSSGNVGRLLSQHKKTLASAKGLDFEESDLLDYAAEFFGEKFY